MPDPKQQKMEAPNKPLPPLPPMQMKPGARSNAKKREAGKVKNLPLMHCAVEYYDFIHGDPNHPKSDSGPGKVTKVCNALGITKVVQSTTNLVKDGPKFVNNIKNEGFKSYVKTRTKKLYQSAKTALHDSKESVVTGIREQLGIPEKENEPGTATSFSSKEQRLLAKLPREDFHNVVKTAGKYTLGTAELNARPEKKGMAEDTESKVGKFKELFFDPATDILAAANLDDVTKFVKAGVDGLEMLVEDGKQLFQLLGYGWKKFVGKISGQEYHATKEDKRNSIKTVLSMMGSHAKYVGDQLGNAGKKFKNSSGVVGLIGSIVSGAVKFVSDCRTLHKTRKSIKRMRAQKENAKQAILAHQASYAKEAYVETTKDGKLKFRDNNSELQKKRIDTVIEEMDTSIPGGDDQKAVFLSGMKNYAISKELTGANQKRRNEAVFNIIVEELGGIVSAALSLAGPCAVAGAGLSAAFSALKAVKSGGNLLMKAGRKIHFPGFNQMKSESNKWQKRQKLAIWTFNSLKEMKPEEEKLEQVSSGSKDVDQIAKVREYLPVRSVQKDRIRAMGVDAQKLARSKTGGEMLDIMRGGFYREG